jgi:hypothetical protein
LVLAACESERGKRSFFGMGALEVVGGPEIMCFNERWRAATPPPTEDEAEAVISAEEECLLGSTAAAVCDAEGKNRLRAASMVPRCADTGVVKAERAPPLDAAGEVSPVEAEVAEVMAAA